MELKFQIWTSMNLHFQFSVPAPYLISGIILKDFSQVIFELSCFCLCFHYGDCYKTIKATAFARLK